MSSQTTAKDKLVTVVDCLAKANDALREVIQIKGDEIGGRLEQFEEEFEQVRDEFQRFKIIADDHNKKADRLQIQMDNELRRLKSTAESLSSEVKELRDRINKQSNENKALESSLKDNVEQLHKLEYQNGNINTFTSTLPHKSEQRQIFIQRLLSDSRS